MPRTFSCGLSMFVLAGVMACRAHRVPADMPRCQGSWRARWSSDSLVAVCLPEGFYEEPDPSGTTGTKLHSAHTWRRRISTDEFTTISIALRRTFEIEFVPLSIPRMICDTVVNGEHYSQSDCISAYNVHVVEDSVFGARAYVETGWDRRSQSGLLPTPTLMARWKMDSTWDVDIHMVAFHMATLDTLRTTLRTVRIGELREGDIDQDLR